MNLRALGKEHAGEVWREFTGCIPEEITLDNEGKATFTVDAGKIAVWGRK